MGKRWIIFCALWRLYISRFYVRLANESCNSKEPREWHWYLNFVAAKYQWKFRLVLFNTLFCMQFMYMYSEYKNNNNIKQSCTYYLKLVMNKTISKKKHWAMFRATQSLGICYLIWELFKIVVYVWFVLKCPPINQILNVRHNCNFYTLQTNTRIAFHFGGLISFICLSNDYKQKQLSARD